MISKFRDSLRCARRHALTAPARGFGFHVLLFAASSNSSTVELEPAPDASDRQPINATCSRRNSRRRFRRRLWRRHYVNGRRRRGCRYLVVCGRACTSGVDVWLWRRRCWVARRRRRLIVVVLHRSHRMKHQQFAMRTAAARRPLTAHCRLTASWAARISTYLQPRSVARRRRIVRLCRAVHGCPDLGRGDMARSNLIV